LQVPVARHCSERTGQPSSGDARTIVHSFRRREPFLVHRHARRELQHARRERCARSVWRAARAARRRAAVWADVVPGGAVNRSPGEVVRSRGAVVRS
jgi:hypothetical protein